jgi:hypothetical protein
MYILHGILSGTSRVNTLYGRHLLQMIIIHLFIYLCRCIPITYIVWWYNTLYQIEPVVWTSIITSRDSDELWCGYFTQQARPDIKYCTKHTMYIIGLSNISIKTNYKQITRVEFKFVHYSQGDYNLCMTSRYFFHSFIDARLLCFCSHPLDKVVR